MQRKINDVLVAWKNKKSGRMPLLMHGARQVGKTYILRDFGSRHYKNTVYVNLESNLAVASYFAEDIRPERLLRYLEAYAGHAITAGETLVVFDEIQTCERALTALKYFCEETPQQHVVAAGSLLGVAINREKFSFPVGKVESVTLFPLDFEEFLLANGEGILCHEIRECYENMQPMPAPLHLKAIDYYRLYLVTGGMPAAINEFLATGKLITVPDVQNRILNDYLADMAKYASNSDSVKIRACYNSVPAQLAKENKKFQYKIVQRGGSATIFGASIEWLNFAGVVLKCQKIQHATEPVSVYADLSSFKLYMGDVGLLTMKSGISQQTVLSGEPNLFMGAVAENYVAQTLAGKGYQLYYWCSEHTAELDFVLQKGSAIIGIEVKKAQQIKSKSLNVFIQKYQPSCSIKLSEKNFAVTDSNVRLVPLYAAFCI